MIYAEGSLKYNINAEEMRSLLFACIFPFILDELRLLKKSSKYLQHTTIHNQVLNKFKPNKFANDNIND